jgi:hypothetical protein
MSNEKFEPVQLDPEMNLGIGGDNKIVYQYDDPTVIAISPSSYGTQSIIYGSGSTEWARIDKDLNLVHLDMDLCAKGPANNYTALGIGIWNAAIEAAAQAAYPDQRDTIRRLKK